MTEEKATARLRFLRLIAQKWQCWQRPSVDMRLLSPGPYVAALRSTSLRPIARTRGLLLRLLFHTGAVVCTNPWQPVLSLQPDSLPHPAATPFIPQLIIVVDTLRLVPYDVLLMSPTAAGAKKKRKKIVHLLLSYSVAVIVQTLRLPALPNI